MRLRTAFGKTRPHTTTLLSIGEHNATKQFQCPAGGHTAADKGSEGEKFARDFLAASGCRAVIGYTTNVDWMHSLVTDMLFLQRFYTDPDPWNNLAVIFDSVKEDYRPAQTLGYTMM